MKTTLDTHRRGGSDWETLVRTAAIGDVALLLVAGVSLGDKEAAAFAAVATGALVLAWRRPLAGYLILGAFFVNVSVWMVPGAASNLRHGEGALDALLPAALAVVSLTGLAGVVGWVFTMRRSGPGRGTARAVGVGGVVLLAAASVLSGVGLGKAGTGVPADHRIETRDAKYSTDQLRVKAGTVTIEMSNHDLFWHTFTVPDLGVNLNVPVRADRTVSFEARAGRYEFVCAIPGHTALGMKGVLVVA